MHVLVDRIRHRNSRVTLRYGIYCRRDLFIMNTTVGHGIPVFVFLSLLRTFFLLLVLWFVLCKRQETCCNYYCGELAENDIAHNDLFKAVYTTDE